MAIEGLAPLARDGGVVPDDRVVLLDAHAYQWTVDSGQWAVGSGQWTVDSGQWTVGSGQWTVGSGQ